MIFDCAVRHRATIKQLQSTTRWRQGGNKKIANLSISAATKGNAGQGGKLLSSVVAAHVVVVVASAVASAGATTAIASSAAAPATFFAASGATQQSGAGAVRGRCVLSYSSVSATCSSSSSLRSAYTAHHARSDLRHERHTPDKSEKPCVKRLCVPHFLVDSTRTLPAQPSSRPRLCRRRLLPHEDAVLA